MRQIKIDTNRFIRMPQEYVDYFDEDMNFLGSVPRAKAHKEGLIHRTFHCWFADPEYLYFQERGLNVDLPGKLDVTVGGHVRSGESIQDSFREINEEIGVNLAASDLMHVGTNRFRLSYGAFRVDEVADVYLARPVSGLRFFKPNPEELSGIVAIRFEEGKALFGGQISETRARKLSITGNASQIVEVIISLESFVPGNSNYFSNMFREIMEINRTKAPHSGRLSPES